MGKEVANLTVEVLEESAPVKVPALDLPDPLEEQSEENESLPKFLPLLAPIWTRAIITKLLSVDASSGVPDIQKLVEIISRNRPLEQIPCQFLPTLRKGVQVLIDNGPGLVPFLRDQISFLEQLKLVVGPDRVQIWEFVGTPLKHAVSTGASSVHGYRLPAPGTPLLMLTDLGVAVPPFEADVTAPDEWLEFVHYVREAGYRLQALTPYAPTRYSRALKRLVKIIQWDRGTSVSTVLRAIS